MTEASGNGLPEWLLSFDTDDNSSNEYNVEEYNVEEKRKNHIPQTTQRDTKCCVRF